MVRQKGFGIIEVVVVLVVIALIFTVGVSVNKPSTPQNTTPVAEDTPVQTELLWQQTGEGWQARGDLPACPQQPIMQMPADLSKVTGVLYPGQTRGGNYKPHGGFRFDTTPNDQVQVTAPLDGFIVRGGHYLAEGEIQYTFDVMNNCGVMYRVGHLRALPEKLQQLTTGWPAAQEGDSRTHQVNPPLYIRQGEALATSVGIVKNKNTFFDWGVYDYRQTNDASKSSAYQQAHMQDKELSWHAVCWFNWLPANDSQKIKSLPAGDPSSGKQSDYCK